MYAEFVADFGGNTKQHVMPKGFVRGEVIQKGAQKEKEREREKDRERERRKDVEDPGEDAPPSGPPAASDATVDPPSATAAPVTVVPVGATPPVAMEEAPQDRIYKPAKLLEEEEEEEARARAKAASPREPSPASISSASDAGGKKKKRELDDFLEEIKRFLLLLSSLLRRIVS